MTIKVDPNDQGIKNKEMDPKFLSTLIIKDEHGLEYKPKSEKEEKHLREVCEYEFSNIETPGAEYFAPYGTTKKNANIYMSHGGKYKLPRFIANWIRQRGKPRYTYKPDGSGRLVPTYAGMDYRYQLNEVF